MLRCGIVRVQAMLDVRTILIGILLALAAAFAFAWALQLANKPRRTAPSPFQFAVGFVTNFFDTLGIGSYAPTTAIFRGAGAVRDELIPGTLSVGHCLPTVAQALFFLQAVDVEPLTLASMIAASVLGAWVGAGFVARMSRRRIRLSMGLALLAAAGLMITSLMGLTPAGGEAIGLTSTRLVVGLTANCLFGALMTVGVGAYAPMLITVSLLGMDPRAAFPIMMGSCAFLTSIANHRFLRANSYDVPGALGLAAGGVPAVIIAATLVENLPLDALRWLVLAVVLFTAASLLRVSLGDPVAEPSPAPG